MDKILGFLQSMPEVQHKVHSPEACKHLSPPLIVLDHAIHSDIPSQFCRAKKQLFNAMVHRENLTMAQFWAEFAKDEQVPTMPYILQLAQIGLVIPVNTACCERGFSSYNIIRSKLRNKLQIMQIDSLLHVKALSPACQLGVDRAS